MRFYNVNVESDDYVPAVKQIYAELGIKSVDMIFATDLFRYLNNPRATIRKTRKLIAHDGVLMIRDCDDSSRLAHPDPKGLLGEIIACSEKAPGMPNFHIGRELPNLIRDGGFKISDVQVDIYNTANLSFEEKEDFFLGSFGSRKSIAKQMLELDDTPNAITTRLIECIDEMEDLFYNSDFWYGESNLLFIAEKQ